MKMEKPMKRKKKSFKKMENSLMKMNKSLRKMQNRLMKPTKSNLLKIENNLSLMKMKKPRDSKTLRTTLSNKPRSLKETEPFSQLRNFFKGPFILSEYIGIKQSRYGFLMCIRLPFEVNNA